MIYSRKDRTDSGENDRVKIHRPDFILQRGKSMLLKSGAEEVAQYLGWSRVLVFNFQVGLSRSLIALLTLMVLGSHVLAQKIEIGKIEEASFRIDVPANWNHGLVVYCHGYSLTPDTFEKTPPDENMKIFLDRGYAVAQSGYSAGGWAIQEAVKDTEALRQYFSKQYGRPNQTYVVGHSLGGFLVMVLMEKFPAAYDGGLALCAPLAASNWFMARRAFDLRAVFDYYFPGVLQAPDKVPADYLPDPDLTKKIEELLNSKPGSAESLRHYSTIRTNEDMASTLTFVTYIIKDLEQRAGGNPFDNRSTIYQGSSDDDMLNDGIKRYAADEHATAYLCKSYTPTGDLSHPLLAIGSTCDPLIPAWVSNAYLSLTEQTGHQQMFRQQYVKHCGHCAMLPKEIGDAFSALQHWKETGVQPRASEVQ